MRRLARSLTTAVLTATCFGISSQVRLAAAPALAENLSLYCDYYYYCDGWDGDYCYDEWYDYECEWYDDGWPPEGGGGGGEEVVTTQITDASITENRVNLSLSPAYRSGRLLVEAVRPDNSTYTLSDDNRAGGSHQLSFQNSSLPDGEYSYVRATWYPYGPNAAANPSSMRVVAFRVLGEYRHSMYNVPYEGLCSGAHVDRDVYSSPCTNKYVANLRYGFATKVELNGTGTSESVGILHTTAGTSCSGAHFYNIPSITGSNGPVGDDTVAKRSSHPHLDYNDQVFLVGAPGISQKEITDTCPGCSQTQLDNFTTNAACSSIVDYGNFRTIRLR